MNTNSINMLEKGKIFCETSILAACSGGIDSIFLLHYLSGLKKNVNLTLHAGYVDHKLRSESVSESKFVDKICHKLEIPFHSLSFDDDFWDDSKKNMEERARKERYRLLHDLAVELRCEYIATGHHLDDQVETILMRMLDRGTGIKGLAGIKPVSQIDLVGVDQCVNPNSVEHMGSPLQKSRDTINRAPAIKIIRPLLHMSRKEIEEKMAGKEFITDQSNNNTDIRRNFYRKEVIPSIEETLKSDGFKKHVYNLSINVQREIEFTKEITKELWESFFENDSYLINRETIEKYSDNFWLTAFSYLFSEHRNFSHCTDALIDIVKFIRKKDPAEANYDPFIFIRNREGIKIQRS